MTTRNAATMGAYNSEWQHRGYCGGGNVAGLMDCHKDFPAIVAGGAEGVFDEVITATKKYPEAIIFGVNTVGMFLPKLDHWVSLHHDHLAAWRNVRWLHQREKEITKYHCGDKGSVIDYYWSNLTPMFCLSGYFAMQIAWLMGCSPIILCGVPGDSRRKFTDLRPRADFGYGGMSDGSDIGVREQVLKEMERLPEFLVTVRSMSGWTRELFGGI